MWKWGVVSEASSSLWQTLQPTELAAVDSGARKSLNLRRCHWDDELNRYPQLDRQSQDGVAPYL